ncbi:M56 family metallopeptidase [Pontibacter sp. BT310]|uniref:M56 family metallopeptidase n=1 Tax=Pontibacter populi TaxID=890055 RepID=A0ABS6X9N7_9BACT|nr:MULTISPECIES: M56 family metallopeptidase [Pontibacter]MBJ6117755.1 M56 family metallopeptidase [Pontibacter sp. BT310]MBR0570181.1 M56 family metallopeptidase [Microvirga sp. STS03]MBW3364607.1 M56 family metallopeptidase [Pontibacter populi]
MNLISQLASEALVKALGWTLLHSLWQGALVALTLALLLVLLQKHKATLRYFMGTGAMLLQLLLSVATFSYYYSSAPDTATIEVRNGAVLLSESTPIVAAAEVATIADPFTTAQLYFEQHLPLLVTLWLLGLVVMALRFLGGLAFMQRLRYRSELLGVKWQQSLQTIASQIGVKQSIQLAESAMVKVPMVIGFAKPVILLPVGAVTGLSMAQVEAILAHELAHIRRNDFLVNLLQSIVDMLFFYHPAMWWMSAVVRDERENCCDDMAVAVCGNSLVYARALAAIAEMQLPVTPKLAMALAGRKGSLLTRIKRLVEQPALRPTFSEGFMAALVIVVSMVFLSVGAMAGMKEEPAIKTLPTNETIAEERTEFIVTAPELEESYSAYSFIAQDTTGKKKDVVIIKNKKGEVTELYVNGKQIPKKDIPEYNDLINQRLEAVKNAPKASRVEVDREIISERAAVAEARRSNRNNREENRYEYRILVDKDRMAVPPPPPAPPAPGAHPRVPLAPIVPPVPPAPPIMPLNLDGKNKAELKKQQKEYERDQKQYEKDMLQFQKDMQQFQAEMSAYSERVEADAGKRVKVDVRRIQGQHEAAMRNHEQSMRRHDESMKRHEESMKRHEELSGVLDNVNKELVKDGLIKNDTEKVDFKIDNTGLYIDGKKQSQELYNKYRSMMKNSDGKPFNYTYKKDGKNREVRVED